MAMIMARRDLLSLFNGTVVPAEIFLSYATTALINCRYILFQRVLANTIAIFTIS